MSRKNAKKERLEENEESSDIVIKLEKNIKEVNKFLNTKYLLQPVLEYDGDPPNYPPTINTEIHKNLLKNTQHAEEFAQDVCLDKNSRERQMDFVIDEPISEDQELYETMTLIRQQSESLFKDLISVQVSFNECLVEDLPDDPIEEEEKEDPFKKHMELIQETCKYDKGLESLYSVGKNVFKNKGTKHIDYKTRNQFNKACEELSNGAVNKVFEDNMQKYEDHPHFLASKQYNNSTSELVPKTILAGILDPFTKLPITKPVKNKHCQHVYDQSSIEIMFQKKLSMACPYIGCTNVHFTKKDLV